MGCYQATLLLEESTMLLSTNWIKNGWKAWREMIWAKLTTLIFILHSTYTHSTYLHTYFYDFIFSTYYLENKLLFWTNKQLHTTFDLSQKITFLFISKLPSCFPIFLNSKRHYMQLVFFKYLHPEWHDCNTIWFCLLSQLLQLCIRCRL